VDVPSPLPVLHADAHLAAVLVPPRRADAIEVIGTWRQRWAEQAVRRWARTWGVPAETLRGWLRRLRCRSTARPVSS
jgi:hypothetical protein